MTTRLEVKGLKECLENFDALEGLAKTNIGRAALIEASSLMRGAMQDRTYTTFKRQTGAIKAGFGTRVGHQLRDGKLTAVVVQYPQSLLGGASPIKTAVIRHLQASSKRPRKIELSQIAFWWWFLERGTGPRKGARQSRAKHPTAKALARYSAAPSRGAIRPRRWVEPAALSTGQASIDAFAQVFREETEKAVTNMRK